MSYSDNNSYYQILSRCLNNPLLSDKDRRQGSIIYDTLAPLCLELAEAYIRMDILESQTYLLTAVGDALDRKTYDFGVTREPATKAKVVVKFYTYERDGDNNIIYYLNGEVSTKDAGGQPNLIEMEVPLDSRFMLLSDTSLVFKYIEKITGDTTIKVAECESYGTKGNVTGAIIPITPITNLVEARIDTIYVMAQDEEDDDTLRKRTQDVILSQGFGGNIDDYIAKVNAIDGVSQCKVFPVWDKNNGRNGGGSVLISIVGSDSNTFVPASQTVIDNVQEEIDPTQDGSGIGTAPIGHIVTITTPVEYDISVEVSLQLDTNYQLASIQDEIEGQIYNYFYEQRKKFKQNFNINIYRSEISSRVLSVTGVINVTGVLLNGVDADVTTELIDDDTLHGQKLPNVDGITIIEE